MDYKPLDGPIENELICSTTSTPAFVMRRWLKGSEDCNNLCLCLCRHFAREWQCVHVCVLHVFCTCVHQQARAGVQEVLPVVSAEPPCHLERKSSVKYSIVWDQAPWQWLSSQFISSKLPGIRRESLRQGGRGESGRLDGPMWGDRERGRAKERERKTRRNTGPQGTEGDRGGT